MNKQNPISGNNKILWWLEYYLAVNTVVSVHIVWTEQPLFYICTPEKFPQVPKYANVRKMSVVIFFE